MGLPLWNLGNPSHALGAVPGRTPSLVDMGVPANYSLGNGGALFVPDRLGAAVAVFGTSGSVVFTGEYLVSYLSLAVGAAFDTINYTLVVDGKLMVSGAFFILSIIGEGWVLIGPETGPVYSRFKTELSFTTTTSATVNYAAQQLESA